MNKRSFKIKMILMVFMAIGSTMLSVLCFYEELVVLTVFWLVMGAFWWCNIGHNISEWQNYDYICFLEFMTYQYMQKIKMEKKEQNAKQEQTNSSKEFKGE
jgi:hypothetical protein